MVGCPWIQFTLLEAKRKRYNWWDQEMEGAGRGEGNRDAKRNENVLCARVNSTPGMQTLYATNMYY